jgi:hypothetical protein
MISRTERFDVDVMEKLLCHSGIPTEVKSRLRKYKKRAIDGNNVAINYKFGKEWVERKQGRIFPDASLGLASFPRQIRSALAKSYYWDVDIENAQPSILREICKKNGWSHGVLDKFIEQRTDILADIMTKYSLTRGEAKDCCIAVLFGGYDDHHPLLIELHNEIKTIAKNCAGFYKELYDFNKKRNRKNKDNLDGSTLAIVLQDEERKILMSLDEFLKEAGRPLRVLIHDGGFIEKLPDETEFPEELLREAEKAILEKTQFELKLAVKPCEHTYDFSSKEVVDNKLNTMVIDFEKNHFYLRDSGVVCEIDEEGTITDRWKLKLAEEAIGNKYVYTDSEGKRYPFILNWAKRPNRRTYDRVGFFPGVGPQNEYNLYRGPIVAREPITDLEQAQAGVDAFMELLKTLLRDNKEHIMFIRQYVAHMLQKPHERVSTAIIFTGGMGLGKDMFWRFIGNHLLGSELFLNSEEYERDVFGPFNDAIAGKLLIKIEEIGATFSREKQNQIKSFITSEDVMINKKCQQPYRINTYHRLVITTNDAVPVVVNADDRRFNIFHVTSPHKGDLKWFENTMNAMIAGKRGIYDWLMATDLTGFSPKKILRTEYHTMLAENEQSSQEQFIDACRKDSDYDMVDRTATDLWTDYKIFCDELGYQICNIQTFGKKLLHYVGDGKLRYRQLNGKRIYTILPIQNPKPTNGVELDDGGEDDGNNYEIGCQISDN